MRYISLFSGIGGFEQGIQSCFKSAECLGYSEIDPCALKIYKKHFPTHQNLGDITKITKKQITSLGRCDLVVGGFPCTNLSSMANFQGDNRGLKGSSSKLFFDLVRVIEYAMKQNKHVRFVIENNNSMKNMEKETVMSVLQSKFGIVYQTLIDNASFGVQSRKRLIWTNFPVSSPSQNDCKQTWDDVLEPDEDTEKYKLSDKMIECLNQTVDVKNSSGKTIIFDGKKFKQIVVGDKKSRWDIQKKSDTLEQKSRPITGPGGGNNILIRRKGRKIILRKFTPLELERLFGLPDYYTDVGLPKNKREKALGNCIPVFIVKHVVGSI